MVPYRLGIVIRNTVVVTQVYKRTFLSHGLPGLGLRDVLVVPSDEKNQMESSPKFLKVIHSGEVFNVVKESCSTVVTRRLWTTPCDIISG